MPSFQSTDMCLGVEKTIFKSGQSREESSFVQHGIMKIDRYLMIFLDLTVNSFNSMLKV